MTLERAIENRTAYLKNGRIPKSTDDYNATLLSIEALYRCQELRKYTVHANYMPLPGETED